MHHNALKLSSGRLSPNVASPWYTSSRSSLTPNLRHDLATRRDHEKCRNMAKDLTIMIRVWRCVFKIHSPSNLDAGRNFVDRVLSWLLCCNTVDKPLTLNGTISWIVASYCLFCVFWEWIQFNIRYIIYLFLIYLCIKSIQKSMDMWSSKKWWWLLKLTQKDTYR